MRISDWSSDVCSSDLCFRNDILRSDQLDLILLALELMLHRRGDGGVDGADAVGEIAGRFDGFGERFGGHRLVSRTGGWESLSTRRTWRSPAESVVRKASRHAFAMRSKERRVGKEGV